MGGRGATSPSMSAGEQVQEAHREARRYLESQGLDQYTAGQVDRPKVSKTVETTFSDLKRHFEEGADLPSRKITTKTLQGVADLAQYNRVLAARYAFRGRGFEDEITTVTEYRERERVNRAIEEYARRR